MMLGPLPSPTVNFILTARVLFSKTEKVIFVPFSSKTFGEIERFAAIGGSFLEITCNWPAVLAIAVLNTKVTSLVSFDPNGFAPFPKLLPLVPYRPQELKVLFFCQYWFQ